MSIDSEPIIPREITEEVAREIGVRYTDAAGVVVTEVRDIDQAAIRGNVDVATTNKQLKTRFRAQFYGDTAHL